MRLHFLASANAESPAWSGDFDSPAGLRRALVSRHGTWLVAVEADRGPVIVLAPSTRYRTVTGGLHLTPADAETLWRECELTMARESAVDAFLNGSLRSLTRSAVFPPPRLAAIKGGAGDT